MKRTEKQEGEPALTDTNILLYVFDEREPEKSAAADALVKKLVREERLVLSAQNLNEFYNIITSRKRAKPLSHAEAVTHVTEYSDVSTVFPVTAEVVLLAMEAIGRYQMSLWDSLVWAVAKLNGVALIYTEDMQSAPEIEGVRYLNPFV